jgi:[ribosomal protein S5]-alanine N-acetyltransferase
MLPFASPADMTTDRLLLRAPVPADADALFTHYTSDIAVARYLPWRLHRSVEETAALIAQCAEASVAHRSHLLVIAERGKQEMPLGLLNLAGEEHCVSVGFGLASHGQGNGYAKEVLRATIDWLLRQPAVRRVWAYCDSANIASARVLARAGMIHEGTLRRYAVHPNISPDPRDCELYANTR